MESRKAIVVVVLALAPHLALAQSDKAEACRVKLIQAQKLDVLYDLKWEKGKLPHVVAGPTFFSMAIDGKEGFAETVNCFLMGGEDKCINFDVRSWQTGKPVGSFRNCRFRMK